jgi:hypothetical protein
MQRRMKEFLRLLYIGQEPEWIVKQMELTEGESIEFTIAMGSLMDYVQLETIRYERHEHYRSE